MKNTTRVHGLVKLKFYIFLSICSALEGDLSSSFCRRADSIIVTQAKYSRHDDFELTTLSKVGHRNFRLKTHRAVTLRSLR